jgi:hypothetical protein
MPSYNTTNAECLIFTYKDGLLSAIAHDLKIQVTQFQVEVKDDLQIEAKFFASSLRVINAMQSGAENPSALSASDKGKIQQTIIDDVLHSNRHTEITFSSTSVKAAGDGYQVEGKLTLHGQSKSISFTTKKEGSKQVAEVKLHQPDFGMKPYSAMLGTLKIKPDVLVRISL